MSETFKFDDISGQPATLEINGRGNHMTVTWGDLTITDASGHVGFWESFGCTAKGAARDAALRKHARQIIEFEIYQQVKFMQEEIRNAS